MSGTDIQTTSAASSLPESALAVRRILESRGLAGTPAPVGLPALRGLPIPDSLRALLPNAVWEQTSSTAASAGASAEAASMTTESASVATSVDPSDLSAAAVQGTPDMASTNTNTGTGTATGMETSPMTDTAMTEAASGLTTENLSTGTVSSDAAASDTASTSAADSVTAPAADTTSDAVQADTTVLGAASVTGGGAVQPDTNVGTVPPTANPTPAATNTAPAASEASTRPAPALASAGVTSGQVAPSTSQAGAQKTDTTILSALAADGRFSTFMELVKFADLESAILDDQYTLLVPTDEAFAALDPALLQAVKADPEVAGYVLGYHVVPGMKTPGQGTLTNVYGAALPADLKVTGKALTVGTSQAYALSSVIVPADLPQTPGQSSSLSEGSSTSSPSAPATPVSPEPVAPKPVKPGTSN
ncbi:hypothetical protein GCM10017783_22000 [Deinococcus piscis]|uniref:FAS1 domain-containing protein n=1 Tax=Deinococcus piscis TaxID=394230 RepID=A0ABQ3KAJ1_9DEIO|nr:fasciclin domain-containing protein [Deinococcus piscis]GHG09015.1 hypothetical protein GCM10017783_22000 [Deinococcus piscis]